MIEEEQKMSLERLKDTLKNYNGNWLVKGISQTQRGILITLEYESKKGTCTTHIFLSNDRETKRG